MFKKFTECSVVLALVILGYVLPMESQGNPNVPLKTAYRDAFTIGAAIPLGLNPAELQLLYTHFFNVTAENAMKTAHLQPSENIFQFTASDAMIDSVQSHGLTVFGHVLIWHQQTPNWFLEDNGLPAGRDLVLARLRMYIASVAGHFAGKVTGWDVVNEAIDDGGGYLRPSKWFSAIGEDYIFEAFKAARSADPVAKLYYNDFNIELKTKRDKTLRLIRELKARKTPIDGIGIQGHWNLDSIPFAAIEAAIIAFHSEGLEVAITELDINVIPKPTNGGEIENGSYSSDDPFIKGLPPEVQQRLTDQYAQLFSIFLKHADKISRVTFWGLHDGRSWLNKKWAQNLVPVGTQTNHPLLWDRKLQPKPALSAVLGLTSPP